MISRKTYRTLGYLISIASLIGLIPWSWNRRKKRLVLVGKWRFKWWQLVANANLIGRILSCVYFACAILLASLDAWEIIFVSAVMTCLTISSCIQWSFLTQPTQYSYLLNSISLFNEKLIRFYKIRRGTQEDGLGRFCKIILFIPISMVLFTPPAVVALLSYRLKSLIVLRILDYIPGGQILGGLGVTAVLLMDCLICLTILVISIVYFNSTSIWLMKHGRMSGRSMRKIINQQKFYRAHQLLHGITDEALYFLCPVNILGCCVFTITTLYSCITLVGKLDNFIIVVLAVAGSMGFFVLYLTIKLYTVTTNSSLKYLNLAFKLNQRKIDRLFFKSCPSLYWRVGFFLKVSDETIAIILKEIIIQSVMNMLLTWTRQNIINIKSNI